MDQPQADTPLARLQIVLADVESGFDISIVSYHAAGRIRAYAPDDIKPL